MCEFIPDALPSPGSPLDSVLEFMQCDTSSGFKPGIPDLNPCRMESETLKDALETNIEGENAENTISNIQPPSDSKESNEGFFKCVKSANSSKQPIKRECPAILSKRSEQKLKSVKGSPTDIERKSAAKIDEVSMSVYSFRRRRRNDYIPR